MYMKIFESSKSLKCTHKSNDWVTKIGLSTRRDLKLYSLMDNYFEKLYIWMGHIGRINLVMSLLERGGYILWRRSKDP